jgi:endonuclease/exonuclease/phosphatase family metal-dependent hydrolase
VVSQRTLGFFASIALSLLACSRDGDVDVTSNPPEAGGDGGDADDSNPQQDGPVDSAPLRLVTWNVHDFYDTIAGNCTQCMAGLETVSTATHFQQKLSATTQQLAKLAGDVVMLQEVENAGILDKIAQSAALASLNYQYRYLFPGNDPRGINIGLLSRYPVDSALSHKDDSFTRIDRPTTAFRYARDCLEVHMTYHSKHVALLGVHFKARPDETDQVDRRLAEAQHTRALADYISQGDPSAYVWVLGDYNDDEGAPAYLAVQNGQSGPKYVDAPSVVAKLERYSYVYNSVRQLIDHLFASPAPASRLDQASVALPHDSTDSNDTPSDHDPIAATYQVP